MLCPFWTVEPGSVSSSSTLRMEQGLCQGFWSFGVGWCSQPALSSLESTLLRSNDLTGVYGCNDGTVLQEYLTQAKPHFEDLIPLCTASIIDYPTNHIYTSRKYGIEWKPRFTAIIYKSLLPESLKSILSGLSVSSMEIFNPLVVPQSFHRSLSLKH